MSEPTDGGQRVEVSMPLTEFVEQTAERLVKRCVDEAAEKFCAKVASAIALHAATCPVKETVMVAKARIFGLAAGIGIAGGALGVGVTRLFGG